MQIITNLRVHKLTLTSKLVINIVNKIFQAFLTLQKSQGKAKFVYIFRIEVLLETIACEGAMFRSFNCSYLKSDTCSKYRNSCRILYTKIAVLSC